MAAFDYQTPLRNRMLVLLALHPDLAPMMVDRPANVPQIGDARPYGQSHKPKSAIKSDYPKLEIFIGESRDEAYEPNPDWTLDMEDENPDREVSITQDMLIKMTHPDLNEENSARQAKPLVAALRRGGRRLADPQTSSDSSLVYLIGWGPAITRRQAEWTGDGARHVTRLTVTCHLVLRQSELDP